MSSTDTASVKLGVLSAWVSLALMLSVQAGTAIWWAGTQNARTGAVELRVAELLVSSPVTYRQVVESERRIAVIDQRIDDILRRLDRITENIERNVASR